MSSTTSRSVSTQILSPRDTAILRRLAEHRYLTSRQIERFFFIHHQSPASAARSCRRVLARLCEQRYLTRLSLRVVGGWAAGSTGYTYYLSRRGYEALLLPPKRAVTRSPLFLEHTLAIADTRLALEEMDRTQKIQLVQVQTEPSNWIEYGNFGLSETLKPDLFVVTAVSAASAYEECWFIELDRGTESTGGVLRQCRQYISYRLSSEGRARSGGFPIVIWLVPTKQRQRELERLVQTLPDAQQSLFKVHQQSKLVPYLRAYYCLGQIALMLQAIRA